MDVKNFYNYAIDKYKGTDCPEADFVDDMYNDKDLPKNKTDKEIFKYLDFMKITAMCSEAADIYYKLKIEYLKTDGLSYFINDNYCETYIIDNNLRDIENESLYGDFAYIITDEDIEKIKNGKILLIQPNDEYSCFLKYKNKEEF